MREEASHLVAAKKQREERRPKDTGQNIAVKGTNMLLLTRPRALILPPKSTIS